MEKNKKKNLTMEDKLLPHLLNFEHHRDDFVVSELVTEQGIKKVLGCSGGLVSSILKKNIKNGFIYRIKSKVYCKKYKQFAFFLTKKGRKRAIQIKRAT